MPYVSNTLACSPPFIQVPDGSFDLAGSLQGLATFLLDFNGQGIMLGQAYPVQPNPAYLGAIDDTANSPPSGDGANSNCMTCINSNFQSTAVPLVGAAPPPAAPGLNRKATLKPPVPGAKAAFSPTSCSSCQSS